MILSTRVLKSKHRCRATEHQDRRYDYTCYEVSPSCMQCFLQHRAMSKALLSLMLLLDWTFP